MSVNVPERNIKVSSGLKYPLGIIGTGICEPDNIVDNVEICNGDAKYDAWIQEKFGIQQRCILPEHLSTSDMCVAAARQALDNARIRPEDLDAIVVVSITPDQITPSTALEVKHQLGAHRAVPLDLGQTACAGGVFGLYFASHLLQNEHIRHVLLIGAETLSRIINPDDRVCRVLFGDGAGALVLKKLEGECNILSWQLRSELDFSVGVMAGGSKKPITPEVLAAGEQYVHMDGKAVWKKANALVPEVIRDVVEQAGLTLDEIRHYILHQANINIIKNVMKSLGQPFEKTTTNIHRMGNTGGATNYTVLHEAITQQKVRDNDYIVLASIGAGFLWGAICMQYRTH